VAKLDSIIWILTTTVSNFWHDVP